MNGASRASRRLKKAHLLRWRPRPQVQRTESTPHLRPSGAASHLDLFEQPARLLLTHLNVPLDRPDADAVAGGAYRHGDAERETAEGGDVARGRSVPRVEHPIAAVEPLDGDADIAPRHAPLVEDIAAYRGVVAGLMLHGPGQLQVAIGAAAHLGAMAHGGKQEASDRERRQTSSRHVSWPLKGRSGNGCSSAQPRACRAATASAPRASMDAGFKFTVTRKALRPETPCSDRRSSRSTSRSREPRDC